MCVADRGVCRSTSILQPFSLKGALRALPSSHMAHPHLGPFLWGRKHFPAAVYGLAARIRLTSSDPGLLHVSGTYSMLIDSQ